jgi:hypothetical protein
MKRSSASLSPMPASPFTSTCSMSGVTSATWGASPSSRAAQSVSADGITLSPAP